MEEILASIRKIISDEGTKPPAATPTGETLTAERPQPTPSPAKPAAVSAVAVPPPVSPPAAGPAAPAEREDVLDLTEVVQSNGAVVSIVRPTVAPERRASFVRTPSEAAASGRPASEPAVPAERPAPADRAAPPANERPDDPLVSSAVAEAAIAAIARVDVSAANAEPGVRIGSGDRTLEDIVRELLRPLLKEWLESKLPPLVEGIVREEIERVVRRSRLR